MGYLFAAVIISLGLIRQHSKIVTVIMGLYMWALIAFNFGTTDYYAFKEIFECAFAERYSHHEPGFLLLCKLMNWAGWSYVQFRMVIGAMIVAMLLYGIKPFTNHLNYTLGLLLIFPFPEYVAELRFSMGIVVVIIGTRYLFSGDKWADIKYVICILIGMMFHYSTLFFLIFLISRRKKITMRRIIILLPVIIWGGTYFIKSGLAFDIVSKILPYSKTQWWLAPKNFAFYFSPLYGISLILLFGVVILLYIVKLLMKQHSHRIKTIADTPGDIDVMVKIEIASMFGVLCAYASGVVFMRLTAVSLPVAYAIISEGFVVRTGDSQQMQAQSRFMKAIFPILVFGVALFVYGYWISLDFLKVYQTNTVFGGF